MNEDCFGYIPHLRQCSALSEPICKKGECHFYKPKGSLKPAPKEIKKKGGDAENELCRSRSSVRHGRLYDRTTSSGVIFSK